MSIFRRLTFPMPVLALTLPAMAAQAAQSVAPQSKHDSSPLIDKVRAATGRFADWNSQVSCDKQAAD